MRKLKILMIGTGLFPIPPPTGGGVERNLYELTLSLSELGHEIVLVNDVASNHEFPQNVKIYSPHTPKLSWETGYFGWVKNFLISLPYTVCTAKRALRDYDFQFDVVHSHDLLSSIFLMKYIRKHTPRVPFFFTNHSPLYRVKLYRGIKKLIRKIGYEYIGPIVWKNVDYLIVHGESLQKELISFFGVDRNKIHRFYQGVNTARFTPDLINKKVLDKFRINHNYFLFVGHLSQRKGVRYLVEAISKLDNVHCVIVGDGPERRYLEDFIKNNDLEKKVILTGLIASNSNELQAIYPSADFFVFPSFSEGSALVIPEALSSGLPIIALNTSGISEIVKNNYTGYILPIEKIHELDLYIKKMYIDRNLLNQMKRNAREFAKNYLDFDSIAIELTGLYIQAVNNFAVNKRVNNK